MTRAATWSNPDGLVVGFGRNFEERNVAATMTQKGTDTKVSKLHITYQSVSGASGARFQLPAGHVLKNFYVKVGATWVGGTSITCGSAGTANGLVTASAFTTPAAGAVIQGDGAFVVGNNADNFGTPQVNAAATDYYITVVGTYTAGEADLYLEWA